MLNIIIPLFNEAATIAELHGRLVKVCTALNVPWQIIYVDDGSMDTTVAQVLEYVEGEQRVALVQLSRNFGQQAAISAGLSHARGDAAVLLDGDLQDPPEVIPELVSKWQAGAQIVVAQRRSRKDSGIRKLGFSLFHRIYKYLADFKVVPHTGTFCLLGREAIDAICDLPESHRFLPALRSWVGMPSETIQYDRGQRFAGPPSQSLRRLIGYAGDAVFSFSLKPLRLMTATGCCICTGSFLAACWFVGKRLLGQEDAAIGFTTLVCAVVGLGGFQLIGLGLIGEYIGRIYEEVKRRPQFVVQRTHNLASPHRISQQP
ncbi:MAG: glycosyltransferase family 2 protein [Pirellulaceae bacterium]|nr:glycosyltransferase family 2 protein [Pirellulaceae bacterium]